MKNKYMTLGMAGVALALVVIGGTFAMRSTQTADTGVTDISVKDIEISVAPSSETVQKEIENAVPGGDVDFSYAVTNEAKEGVDRVDVYVRAIIYKQWEDVEESNTDDSKKNKGLDGSLVSILQNGMEITGTDTNLDNWIVGYEDEEEVILYYKHVLKNGESTDDFISGIRFSTAIDNAYAGKKLTIDIEVDSVQSTVGVSAMQSAWGVSPTIDDETGDITDISETW